MKIIIFTISQYFHFRYLAVVFPVSSKTIRTKQNTILAISLGWGVSLLFSSPAFFFHGLVASRAAANQVQTPET